MVKVIRRSFNGNRRTLRRTLVSAFLDEDPGTGKGDLCTRYIYEVEASDSGHIIQLHRPAFLNKGIDFTVRCMSIRFNPGKTRWRHVPKHDDLADILTGLQRARPRLYRQVQAAIICAFQCRPIEGLDRLALLTAPPLVPGHPGCPADVAVLVAKWLFAEQDLTYWNYSGRTMLFQKLRNAGLV
jgi:hypothetical protein